MTQQQRDLEVAIVQTLDFGDLESSRQAFERLAAESAAAGDPAAAAAYLTQVARTQGLAGRYDDAGATLDRAAGLAGDLLGPPGDHARARVAIERGRVANSSGDATSARPLFEEAFTLATAAGTAGLAVDALHMSAIAVGRITDPSETATSESLNRAAIALAESSDEPAARRWLGSLYNNLGWGLHGDGDYVGALDLFERALVVREEQGSKPETTVARWAVARTLRSLGRLDDALLIQRALEADPDNADDGYIPEEIGEALVELGRVEEAKASFARAHRLLSADPWLVEHEPERLARLAEYADGEAG